MRARAVRTRAGKWGWANEAVVELGPGGNGGLAWTSGEEGEVEEGGGSHAAVRGKRVTGGAEKGREGRKKHRAGPPVRERREGGAAGALDRHPTATRGEREARWLKRAGVLEGNGPG